MIIAMRLRWSKERTFMIRKDISMENYEATLEVHLEKVQENNWINTDFTSNCLYRNSV